ncbi:hypothetical protein QFZ41_001165 [Luteibacter sp. W1I16]|uniref:DUF3103 family protein n=1 Tax=Luteibacter sp. W1I16 TaxID=3373922 RepID=UPI003D1C39A2
MKSVTPGRLALAVLVIGSAFWAIPARAIPSTGDGHASTATTILRRILLRDDKEPDAAGAAEIFAVVSGVGHDGKARVEIHPMPWLTHDRRWFYPDHPLVDWSLFSAGYVNIQLFEDDGAARHDRLIDQLAEVLASLETWLPGSSLAAARSQVQTMGDLVLATMRTRAFLNETDYVDSFYVIERGKKYLNQNGAARNAMLTLEPGG